MLYSLLCIRTFFGQRKWSKVTLSIQKYSPILKSCHLQLCKISRIYIQGYIIGSILCTMNKETPYDASKKYFYYFWNGWLLKLFGWRKYLTKRGKQNMGAWNFVRQAFFRQKAPVILKALCPLRPWSVSMGSGTKCPPQRVLLKN